MKKLLIIGVLMGLFVLANAQDVIYLTSGTQQNGKVLQVNVNEVSYKKAENPDGPVYIISKSDISMIEYQNGAKDVFNNNPNYSSTNPPSNPIYSQPNQTIVRPQVTIIAPPVYNAWGYAFVPRGWGHGWRHRGHCGGGWGGGHHRW